MTSKETMVVLGAVALVGASSMSALGTSMSQAIVGDVADRVSPTSSARVGAQAAAWGSLRAFVDWAEIATDAELFDEWARTITGARRELLNLNKRVTELGEADARNLLFAGDEAFDRRYIDLALTVGERVPIFDRAQRLARRAGGLRSINALHLIGDVLTQHGRLDEARAMFDAALERTRRLPLDEERPPAETLRRIGDSLARAGFVDEAGSTFAEAFDLLRDAPLARDRGWMLRTLAETDAEHGFVDAARVVFAEALAEVRASRKKVGTQTMGYTQIAEGQARVGLMSDSRATFAALLEMVHRDDAATETTLRTIAESRARAESAGDARAKHVDAPGDGGDLSVAGRLRLLEQGDLGSRVTELRERAWLEPALGDPERLRTFASAIAEEWERFAAFDDEAFAVALEGVGAVAKVVLLDRELLTLGRQVTQRFSLYSAEGLAQHEGVVEALSRTPLAFLHAKRSVRAMLTPEPRPLTRGLIVERKGMAYAEELVRSFDEPIRVVDASRAKSIAELEATLAGIDDTPTLLLAGKIAMFAARNRNRNPERVAALLRFMDEHPRVMVIGEATNPASLDPILREPGRFGPYYARGEP